MIWPLDHNDARPLFDELFENIAQAGIEVWRVDLLEAYFLPRSSEIIRTLNGEGVATLLHAAHKNRNKKILLAAYDRMPLPLLRGIRQWQTEASESRLIGALLFYPNLFGPPPTAGEPPAIDPILSATNIPLVIYQPALGSHRWRMKQVLETLWQAGSPSYLYLVPKVRDWFFMGEGDAEPTLQEIEATQKIPQQIKHLVTLLTYHPQPSTALSIATPQIEPSVIHTLVELAQPKPAPGFDLADIEGKKFDTTKLNGKVVLLNFWATWCPPCVEEIPSLNRLKQVFAPQDLQIVSIDFRETPQEMSNFLLRIPVDFPVLMDREGLTAFAWQVFSFPSSFIIDRTGQIRYSANRAINWDGDEVIETINRLLAE
jgi:thiol-disulfide isomerase/thioredoxin